MYLDESGDHDLVNINDQYPVFVLAGTLMRQDYHDQVAAPKMSAYKRDLWGRENIILHTADIVRSRNGFEDMQNEEFRNRFFDATNTFMETLNYKIVACAIRKYDHEEKYGGHARDPYFFSLNVLVERFCFEINARGFRDGGLIIAESRGAILDQQLTLAWESILERGTDYLRPEEVKSTIRGLEIRDKAENICGLQISDLVASPIGRHVIGLPEKKDWEIVKAKFRTNWAGRYTGFGLVILPRK